MQEIFKNGFAGALFAASVLFASHATALVLCVDNTSGNISARAKCNANKETPYAGSAETCTSVVKHVSMKSVTSGNLDAATGGAMITCPAASIPKNGYCLPSFALSLAGFYYGNKNGTGPVDSFVCYLKIPPNAYGGHFNDNTEALNIGVDCCSK